MTLHPVVQKNWERLKATGYDGFAGMPVAEARAHYDGAAQALGPGPDMADVSELKIPVDGAEIAARLYEPFEVSNGLCVYFHGGGWVLGELEGFDNLCRTLALRSGCAVLSVDYRLAPEHPFPTPLNDVISSIRWAANLPLAKNGIAVAGDSAGGNLITVASLELRGEISLRLQVMFNPATDSDVTRASYAKYGKDYLLKTSDSVHFFGLYAHGHDLNDPRIAPLRNPDLRGAPPAWIGVAEYDILRDEGEAFAAALEAAGTRVTLRRYDGVMHGFARGYGTVDTSDRAVSEASEALRTAFESTTKE